MTELNPRFLEVEEVVELNRIQTTAFGGLHQVRDPKGLESAVMMPRQSFGGSYLHPTIEAMTAAYVFHIAMNHPFMDGNKRTALYAADNFLSLNGYDLLSSPEHYEMVMKVVTQGMSKEEIAEYVRKHIVRIE